MIGQRDSRQDQLFGQYAAGHCDHLHGRAKALVNRRVLAAVQQAQAHPDRDEHVVLDPRRDRPWFEGRAFRRSYWEPTLRRLGHAPSAGLQHPTRLRHDDADGRDDAAFCVTQLITLWTGSFAPARSPDIHRQAGTICGSDSQRRQVSYPTSDGEPARIDLGVNLNTRKRLAS
jgi:hypothetical protein